MLKNLQTKRSEGFTIIEVLIVLAIAGLILLVVFLAVPALQRNSRNTQRRSSIATILGAVNEYASNNAGSLPADDAAFTAGVDNLAADGFYGDSNTTFATSVPGTLPAANANAVYIYGNATCTNATTPAAGGSARSFVAYFWVEGTGTNLTAQCQAG